MNMNTDRKFKTATNLQVCQGSFKEEWFSMATHQHEETRDHIVCYLPPN